jgi:hypothetical protein
MKSILDASFKYRPAASHTDPEAFRRRQLARRRIVEREAKRKVVELRKKA